MASVYRLILETAPGRVDTGATYEGCTRANTNACQPIQFSKVEDAIQFAHDNGEIPVRVPSAEVAWSIVDGKTPITDDMVITGSGGGFLGSLDPTTLAIIGVGAVVILPMLLGKRHAS